MLCTYHVSFSFPQILKLCHNIKNTFSNHTLWRGADSCIGDVRTEGKSDTFPFSKISHSERYGAAWKTSRCRPARKSVSSYGVSGPEVAAEWHLGAVPSSREAHSVSGLQASSLEDSGGAHLCQGPASCHLREHGAQPPSASSPLRHGGQASRVCEHLGASPGAGHPHAG